MRALLIDDDTLMRKMLRKIISSHFDDIEFVEAEDGKKGMAAFDDAPDYTFAVIDFEMPEANGFEVVTYIRKEKKNKTIPLLMCTSRQDRKTVVKMLQAGANDYLTKPFEPDRVINKIEKILKRGERLRALRAAGEARQSTSSPAAKTEPNAPAEPVAAAPPPSAPEQQQSPPASTPTAPPPDTPPAEEPATGEESKEKGANASLRHGNIGDDVIDDSADEKVYVDITATDDDDDAVEVKDFE